MLMSQLVFLLKVSGENGLSFTKIFNTNINNLSDFINGSDDYAYKN